MPRRRASVPRYDPNWGKRANSPYDSEVLGNGEGPSSRRTAEPVEGDIPLRYAFEYNQPLTREQTFTYDPTATIDRTGVHPRTLRAGYDEPAMTLTIQFREGAIYNYYQVPPSVWYQFQRVASPGRFINSRLNSYPYDQTAADDRGHWSRSVRTPGRR